MDPQTTQPFTIHNYHAQVKGMILTCNNIQHSWKELENHWRRTNSSLPTNTKLCLQKYTSNMNELSQLNEQAFAKRLQEYKQIVRTFLSNMPVTNSSGCSDMSTARNPYVRHTKANYIVCFYPIKDSSKMFIVSGPSTAIPTACVAKVSQPLSSTTT